VARWWSHLASLVNSAEGPEAVPAQDLIAAVQQFMEQSSLGDFTVRLRLIKAFHCQAAFDPTSKAQSKTFILNLCISFSSFSSKGDLRNILWNAHVFYSQFSGPVATRLQNLRAPIEKKLKEAVKIARWTDTNYWALRQSVEKTHRTLFKQMREYQV